MHIQFRFQNLTYQANLSEPIDISIPLIAADDNVRAWYVDPIAIEPVKGEGFVGEVRQGGAVNFKNIFFNPHGHGTHTECVGHISVESESVNQALSQFHFMSELISVTPETRGEDNVITLAQLKALKKSKAEAIIIRTYPNQTDKKHLNYSNTNPPYLEAEAAEWLRLEGVSHLLIDLPSVDKEVDGGALLAHRAFWEFPENTRHHATITEMVFVPDEVADGQYLLNLQMASFENDASPSKPVLFKLNKPISNDI